MITHFTKIGYNKIKIHEKGESIMNNLLPEGSFLRGITLVYENCNYLNIPIQFIEDISLSGISQAMQYSSPIIPHGEKYPINNGITSEVTVSSAYIIIDNSYFSKLNKLSHKKYNEVVFIWDDLSTNNKYDKFGDKNKNRLISCHDITQISLIYSDKKTSNIKDLSTLSNLNDLPSVDLLVPYKGDEYNDYEKIEKAKKELIIEISKNN